MADDDDARAGSANRKTRIVTLCLVSAHVIGGLASARAANSFLADYSMQVFFSVVLSQAGLLGMWLGLASTPWKIRLFGSLLGLAYLAIAINSFIPPNVPLVATLVYSVLMLVPCLGVALFMGCLRRCGATVVASDYSDAGRPALQFSIRHLLILTGLVALILTLKPTGVEHTMLTSLVLLAAIGLCATCVFLGALWAALVAGHPAPRIPVVLALAAFMGTLPPYYVGMKLGDTASMAAASCIQAAIIISSLLMVRSLGYRLVRQNQDSLASGSSDSTPSPQSPFVSLLVVAVTVTAACGLPRVAHANSPKTIEYHGIRPTDPGGCVGLRNPERGWRIETIIAEPVKPFHGPAKHLVGKLPPIYNDDWWTLDAQKFEPFGLTLVQAYCYLTEYADGPIPQEKLDLLQKSLDTLRAGGLKAVLRFAYETDMQRTKGPKTERILQHLDQLEPIIRRNVDVIYVLQAGCVGAWGEWHSATHIPADDYQSRAAIVKRLLEALPDSRMTQVRVPRYKRLALSEPIFDGYEALDAEAAFSATPAARIGFHNDGFLAGKADGGTWPEGPHFGSPGNPEFDIMTAESAYLPVDGELFWSDQAWDGKEATGSGVDGFNAAVRMRLHHYSSFSLAHSYSWREGKNFSIDRWQTAPLTIEQAQQARLPISDGYFGDAYGRPVTRTAFEYIQDHLGYRIELQSAQLPSQLGKGDRLTVELELINRGYSTLHNPRPVYVALIDIDGSVTPLLAADANPRTWQPFEPSDAEYRPLTHHVRIDAPLPDSLPAGWYRLGLWLPDASKSLRFDPRYAVRVANRDAPWWTTADGRYGINVLGVVEIVE